MAMPQIEEAIEAEIARRLAEAMTTASPVPVVYTVDEAAECLRVSRSTVYKMLSDGELVASRVTRRVLIPATEVARVLDLRVA